MALSLGETVADHTGERGSDSDYLQCTVAPGAAIRMHLDAIDGIANDVLEGVKSLPKRGAEIGGLLLGKVETEEPRTIGIERYQRIECGHRFGPQFALDAPELEGLEAAAATLSSTQDLSVVGLYRSNTRPEFQIEQSDFEILDRYFPDPGDLALLIQPVNLREIEAQFFNRNATRAWEPVGARFPFRGRVVGPLLEPEPEPEAKPEPAAAQPVSAERPRRLVPDFLPAGESPRVPPPIAEPAAAAHPLPSGPSRHADPAPPNPLKRWWPLAGALVLVGGALYFLFQSQTGERGQGEQIPQQQAQTQSDAQPRRAVPAGVIRPLGLSVDPSGDTWRVSWNPSASALQGARNVALFAREGEDQNRIDLADRDLRSGTYQYQPRPAAGPTRDVTFRIEVTDASGNVSAESFRLMRTSAASGPVATSSPAPAAKTPRPAASVPTSTHPKPVKRVAPIVPASIRPRIHGTIPVDVRVTIDARGRVTQAVPTVRARSGLNSFLTARAVAAALQWKFEPAAGTEVIHFVFQP